MSFIHPKNGDAEDYTTRALMMLLAWMLIGWLPMAALGFACGLLLNLVTDGTNFTTGATLTGMAAYIPVGIYAYHLRLKNYWKDCA